MMVSIYIYVYIDIYIYIYIYICIYIYISLKKVGFLGHIPGFRRRGVASSFNAMLRTTP